MLKPMCNACTWVNTEVIGCHHAPPETPRTKVTLPSGERKAMDCGSRASLSTSGAAVLFVARMASHTSTLRPISTNVVRRGSATRCPPYGVRACRVERGPSLTQVGHWNPTEAERMQSGQIGREQRWHLIQVSRSVWR